MQVAVQTHFVYFLFSLNGSASDTETSLFLLLFLCLNLCLPNIWANSSIKQTKLLMLKLDAHQQMLWICVLLERSTWGIRTEEDIAIACGSPYLTWQLTTLYRHTHTPSCHYRRPGRYLSFFVTFNFFFLQTQTSLLNIHTFLFFTFFPFILLRATTVFSCVVQNLMYTQFVARGDSSSSSSSSASLLGIFPLDCSLLWYDSFNCTRLVRTY